MTTLAALQTLIAQGKSATPELERSSSERRRAGEPLCAFLDRNGGVLLLGVGPYGKLAGPPRAGAITHGIEHRARARPREVGGADAPRPPGRPVTLGGSGTAGKVRARG